MKEKLKTGDEMDAVWARGILKCFDNHARASKQKRIIGKRRRRLEKLRLREIDLLNE
jgi:hypothetical protein